ncbi:hypothetical protein AZ34_03855 [Hylemonella gracilis str. Niagara R]|uniref:DUF4136 domain-containing protein n=1 Tax=Hylemonella gracilis str. Niagara R TaxID=1458275 RepID=A0A016XFE5_9BURK|nr:DUF4136 domain-containing protein [Hylemonella gracilis]EYC50297.1 hypothetical protein AZ34_03855 [Hylemonella gracilis str. Niagara R]
MPHRIAALICTVLLALLATACSGLRTIESQVQATVPAGGASSSAAATTTAAAAPLGPGARYRYERLPSQAEDPARAETIEAMADAALKAVGMVRDDQQPRYSVQIQTSVEAFYVDDWGRRYPGMPPYSPGFFGELGVFVGPGRIGPGTRIGMGWTSWPPSVRHAYGVSLLMRDLESQRIVYETRASHEGPWGDSDRVLPALLKAALQDFPAPHTGPVKIQIPR